MSVAISINGSHAFDTIRNTVMESVAFSKPLDSIKDNIKDAVSENFDYVMEQLKEFFIYLGEEIKHGTTLLMQQLVDLILTTPLVADNLIIVKIWTITRTISFCLIGMMFVWEGFKKVTSNDSVGRAVSFKDMFVRLIYGLMLAVFSLDIVDIIIQLNNGLVATMKDNFPIMLDSNIDDSNAWSFIVTLALLIVQLVLGIKIAIQYFMRLAEIWLMSVIGPIFYTLWISPNLSGYLGGWLRRLFTTIFTTFVWSLILVLYTGMVSTVALSGTVWGMCMSIALLLVMLETPGYLRQFMDSHQSPLQMMNNVKNKAVAKAKITKAFTNNVYGKVAGFIKPKSSV